MELNINDNVFYNSSPNSVACGSDNLSWDYWRQYPDFYRQYYSYPVYINTNTTRYEDTYKKAFNIAKLLLKKNLLVSKKLKDFIGLVEEIAKEL